MVSYTYCSECREPIQGHSTFEESVIRGIMPKKKLKATCGRSKLDGFKEGRCRDCYLALKKQFKRLECDCKTCIKMVNGFCGFIKPIIDKNPDGVV